MIEQFKSLKVLKEMTKSAKDLGNDGLAKQLEEVIDILENELTSLVMQFVQEKDKDRFGKED